MTTRDPRDLPYLRECMATEIAPIGKAGLLPTASHIEVFSNALEDYGLGHGSNNLHKALLQFNDLANVQSDYFVCRQGPMVDIAKEVEELDLSIVSMRVLLLKSVQTWRSMQCILHIPFDDVFNTTPTQYINRRTSTRFACVPCKPRTVVPWTS